LGLYKNDAPHFFRLPVGEGWDGSKTRNAVIEPVEMDGVDSFIEHNFYKRVIPLGFRDAMNFKNSHPPEGCPPDGVGSHRGVADAVCWGGLCIQTYKVLKTL